MYITDWTRGNSSDPDPGNLFERIDESVRSALPRDHRAIDGRPHVTPEEFERLVADLFPPATWRGCSR